MDLAVAIYRLTQEFPRNEVYGLASQLQRAAVPIPSNIAEGHSREGTREYLHFVSVAQGSVAELETQLELSARLEYCSRERVSELIEQTALVGRQLYAPRNALQRRLPPTPDS
jgi:four helix bundle protein